MTIIVHPVGQGDLRNDIVGLSSLERQDAQKEAQKKTKDFLDAKDAEGLLGLLLEPPAKDSRFSAPPLSLILRSLCPAAGGPTRMVTVLLLVSRSGSSGTWTSGIGELLGNALGLEGVHDGLLRKLRLDVRAEMLNANLSEAEGIKSLTERLGSLVSSQAQEGTEPDVVVNAISGASMIALGAMGAADRLGLDWRAAVAPGAGKDTAVLLDRTSYETAPFHWLRSLGYVEQARDWAKGRAAGMPLPLDSLNDLVCLMERLATDPTGLDDRDLASLLALDMARADNGAGLVARAWAQKHYLTLHEQDAPCDLIAMASQKKGNGNPPQLGHIIAVAQETADELGDDCPASVRWLLEHRWLNGIGTAAVHDLAAPSASEVTKVLALDEIAPRLPDWLARPGRGAVLFIVPCGVGAPRGMHVTERVLSGEPDKEIRRAVPGAMLDGAGALTAEFLLLHSSNSRSKKTALDEAAASFTARVDAGWERHTPVLVDLCDYGGDDDSEYVATPSIMRTVKAQIALALGAKRPAAVVIVGTGQKAAVLGALQAAQAWCAGHAAPLFLQTFVDERNEGARKRSIPQLHRLALHNDAEHALREAALHSLRSLNLLSATRVLAAGDRDMDELANKCSALRQRLLEVANDEEDPDRGAGVLIDLLKTVADLWEKAPELTRMRLAVIVAEALNFSGRRLLSRNNNPQNASGGIDLGRPCPKDCGEKKAKDKGPHRDLLEVLYRVRNHLVVTHADGLVEPALRAVLQDLGVEGIQTDSGLKNVKELTYPDILRLTCTKLEEAACVLGVEPAQSSWKTDFECLMADLKSGPRARAREPRAEDHAAIRVPATVLVNLTPHDVVVDPGDGTPPVRFPASGTVPRLVLSESTWDTVAVVAPARDGQPGAVIALPLAVGAAWRGVDPPLPEPRPDTLYLTSRVVAEHFPHRTDLVWPDDLVRDAEGRVIAARRLARLASADDCAAGQSERSSTPTDRVRENAE